MINETQQKILTRLVHLGEFAPCNTIEFDYELQKKGLVKINKMTFEGKEHLDTSLTTDGINRSRHLSEENRI